VIWFGLALLVGSLTKQGRLAEAMAVLENYGFADREPSPTSHGLTLLAARSGLYLALGDTARARADALRFLERAAARGARFPFGVRLIAAQAYLQDGDSTTARQLADEELDVAGSVGWVAALGAAQRVRAALAQGRRKQDLLQASIDTLETSPHRLELAHSLVELGSALRKARNPIEARHMLRRGLDLAQRCDAAPLAERAHAELVATGARPRRRAITGPDALTTTERRVAELAQSGLTNRQIAQALFVTRKTIETHLLAAYRKLGITKRDELARVLP
jgi:DNA-binding CsgD family transcriptional regulator